MSREGRAVIVGNNENNTRVRGKAVLVGNTDNKTWGGKDGQGTRATITIDVGGERGVAGGETK